jgi:hypothetical protein
MAADIMTKALCKVKHENFMEMTGIESTTPSPVEDNYLDRKEDNKLVTLVALTAWNSGGHVEIRRLPSHPRLGAETMDWKARHWT